MINSDFSNFGEVESGDREVAESPSLQGGENVKEEGAKPSG